MQYSKHYLVCQVDNYVFLRLSRSSASCRCPESFPFSRRSVLFFRSSGLQNRRFFLIFFGKFFDIQIRSAYSYTL